MASFKIYIVSSIEYNTLSEFICLMGRKEKNNINKSSRWVKKERFTLWIERGSG